VITTQPADFVTVDEVKTHTNKSGTADDAELGGFVSAACRMIRERIGEVSAVTAVEDARARRQIVLEARPVISVTSVQTLPGLTAVPAADPSTGVAGWSLDGGAGVLTHTSRWPSQSVRVTYQAGRSPLPGNVRLAALELAAHLWRSSQLNSGGVRPLMTDSEAPVMPGSAYALPIRVRELLGLGSNPTDEILVG
jgi:hypothetical protein